MNVCMCLYVLVCVLPTNVGFSVCLSVCMCVCLVLALCVLCFVRFYCQPAEKCLHMGVLFIRVYVRKS